MSANQQNTYNLPGGIVLLCVDISPKFKNKVVFTTRDKLKGYTELKQFGFKALTQCELKQKFKEIYEYLTQYDEKTLISHYQSNSKEWQYWCTYAILFFVTRFLLLGREIPCLDYSSFKEGRENNAIKIINEYANAKEVKQKKDQTKKEIEAEQTRNANKVKQTEKQSKAEYEREVERCEKFKAEQDKKRKQAKQQKTK